MCNDKRLFNLKLMESDNYFDVLTGIEGISNGDSFVYSLLLNNFYQNPPKAIHNDINSILDKILKESKHKSWICGHDGCKKICSRSHELSEKSMLKNLGGTDDEVLVFKLDQANNAFQYIVGDKSIGAATRFPGYCSNHDQELFQKLDTPNQILDIDFVNRQALRMLKYSMFDYERHIRICDEFIRSLGNLIVESNMVSSEVKLVKKEINRLQKIAKKSNRYVGCTQKLYKKIWGGIQTKKYIVKYTEMPCERLGWAFSQAFPFFRRFFRFTSDFIFKIDVNSRPVLIYAWISDRCSVTPAPPTLCNITSIIMRYKEKLIFSKKSWSLLDEFSRRSLLDNDEISNNSSKSIGVIPCSYALMGDKCFSDSLKSDS